MKLLIILFGWLLGLSKRREEAARVETIKQEARADRAEADLAAAETESPQAELKRRFGRGPVLKIMAMLVLGSSLTACATPARVVEFCLMARIITVGDDDRLSDATARQLLAHNLLVEKRCLKGKPQ